MKHIATTIPDLKAPTTGASGSIRKSASEPCPISRTWVDALFTRFSQMWPKAWADVMDLADVDGMSQEWEEGLAGLTGEEIKTGLEVSRASRTWPPAIAEFRADCRPANMHKSAAYRGYEPSHLLTKATREDTEDLAADSFARMRQALRT